jgi:UDP-N-acetylmuramoylalanine--D-glutamate ligase
VLISELAAADIGILGFGREGRAAWKFLRERLPDKQLVLYSEDDLDTEIRESLDPERDLLLRGPLQSHELKRHDLLVRSPGISPYRQELRDAAAAGVEFTSASSLWFAANPEARTICITGTKGKSTTTALTAHLLRASGLEVITAGNIGRPMLEFRDAKPDWWVIELSSYQLCDLEARPDIGAITNLSDEHLDWHGGQQAYRADKLRLADLLQGRPLVGNYLDLQLREALHNYPGVHWFNGSKGFCAGPAKVLQDGVPLSGTSPPGMPGRHNLANVAAAMTLAAVADGLPGDVAAALSDFQGLPHRLHELGTRNGLRYIDDSLSTTPVATLAALEALAGGQVTLLLGGLNRGLDWRAHTADFIRLAPNAVIGIPDSGPHILAMLEEGGLEPEGGMHQAQSLGQAVQMARKLTPPGGIVLLSPGAPSFPQFRDYRERAEVFANAAGFTELR